MFLHYFVFTNFVFKVWKGIMAREATLDVPTEVYY